MSAAAMEDRLHRLESRVQVLESQLAALTAKVEPPDGGAHGDPLGREAIHRLDPDDPHQEATREVPPPPG